MINRDRPDLVPSYLSPQRQLEQAQGRKYNVSRSLNATELLTTPEIPDTEHTELQSSMIHHHPNGIRSPHGEEPLTKTDMMAHAKHTCGLRWAISIPLDAQAVQRPTKSELRIGNECWVCVENLENSEMRNAEEGTDAFQRGSTWVDDPPLFPSIQRVH